MTVISTCRCLDHGKEIALGLGTDRVAFDLVNTSIGQLLAQTDARFDSAIEFCASAVIAPGVWANCSFEIAAANEFCPAPSKTEI